MYSVALFQSVVLFACSVGLPLCTYTNAMFLCVAVCISQWDSEIEPMHMHTHTATWQTSLYCSCVFFHTNQKENAAVDSFVRFFVSMLGAAVRDYCRDFFFLSQHSRSHSLIPRTVDVSVSCSRWAMVYLTVLSLPVHCKAPYSFSAVAARVL